MINVGDVVKVISKTNYHGEKVAFYPIGTVCIVQEICEDGEVGILPQYMASGYPYYYLEEELEKGHFEWIKD